MLKMSESMAGIKQSSAGKPKFNEGDRQRRNAEQARRILNSRPLGLPQPQQKVESLDACLVSESFAQSCVFGQRQQISKSFYFKNTGAMAITKGSALVRNEGDQVETKCVPIELQVQPGSIFEVSVEFETPMEPGHYQFGMQIQFG